MSLEIKETQNIPTAESMNERSELDKNMSHVKISTEQMNENSKVETSLNTSEKSVMTLIELKRDDDF